MNVVRLCFQCELEWEDGKRDFLNPIVSNPVYDKSKITPLPPKHPPDTDNCA